MTSTHWECASGSMHRGMRTRMPHSPPGACLCAPAARPRRAAADAAQSAREDSSDDILWKDRTTARRTRTSGRGPLGGWTGRRRPRSRRSRWRRRRRTGRRWTRWRRPRRGPWRRWRPQMTQPAVRGTGAGSATVRRVETDARQARWADIVLAGKPGADHLQISAARSCWSCWSRELTVEACRCCRGRCACGRARR